MAVWNPRANEIFASVLESPPAQRQASLERACSGDGELRREVEALLAAHAQAGSFLDDPAPGVAPADEQEPTTAAPDSGPPLSAGNSVLRALGAVLPKVPQVQLRDPDGGAHPAIVRPNSPEMPEGRDPADRLQLHGEIARGGMGAVLRGRDVDLGREIAVKVLLESHAGRTELLQRFVEEAQIAGQLQHPGIVPVYEFGQLRDRRPYFTMKLVRGQTLAKLLAQRADPAQERPRWLGVFLQACQALAYAHAHGVIHRDLKPANVMVGAYGEVQVLDWGLAKVLKEGGVADENKARQQGEDLMAIRTHRSEGSDARGSGGTQTQAGSVLGTPAYMPPEQALGEVERLDERSDVFGLGAILCEILTGRPPYVGPDFHQVHRKAIRADLGDAFARLDGCGADAELAALCKSCLAAEPQARPRDAGQVAEAVTAYQHSVAERLRQAELAGAEARARAAEERKRRRLTLALAALVLLTVLLGGGGWVWMARLQAARDRQIRDALAQASALAKEDGKWAEAWATANRAEALLENGPADPELVQRVQALLRELNDEENDRQLLARLDKIQVFMSEMDRSSSLQPGVRASGFTEYRGLPEYDRVFAESGLNLSVMPVDEVVRQFRERPAKVREALVAALDDWLELARRYKAPGADRLARVLAAADPDPWRQQLRAALARDDWAALHRLAATEEFERQRPQTIVLLARRLWSKYPKRAAEVLRVAQQRFPADFWINHLLSRVLRHRVNSTYADRAEYDEPIRFASVAQALRPSNYRVLNLLGESLFDRGRYDEALLCARRAIELAPDQDSTWANLSRVLRAKGDIEEANAARQKAAALQPKPVVADNNPNGAQLWNEGRIDEAVAAFRRWNTGKVAVPLYAVVGWSNLGATLFEKGRFNEAADAYKKAVDWNPELARVAEWSLLITTGRSDEAIALCRKAIAEQPSDAVAYACIAFAQHAQGNFVESGAAFRRARELSPTRANFGAPWMRWIREAERMEAIDSQWSDYTAGKRKPQDRSDRRLLTLYCAIRKQYLAAARLHEEGLTADPAWADDLAAEARYDAGRYAALVAADRGEDTAKLNANERSRWRKQATAWLWEELGRQAKHLASAPPIERTITQDWLRWWLQEPDLASLRDKEALAKLPAEEQQACRKLWTEVEALLQQSRQKMK